LALVYSLFWQFNALRHWRACLLCLVLLVINSSCQSIRPSTRSGQNTDRRGAGSGDSTKLPANSNSPSGESSATRETGNGQAAQTTDSNPAELEKKWQKVLGRKDYLRGDLKLEGTWNITYNETELASPVIMLVRPQHFVYISIRPALGIEMLRIILRPDSVWMISRLNRNYWNGTWAELEPSLGMPLDYRWFQDALLHGHSSLIDLAVTNKRSPPSVPDHSIRLQAKPSPNTAYLFAEWGRWPSKIHTISIQSPAGKLNIDYSKIFETESASLPAQMTFALTIPRNNALLEMNWKEPKFQVVELPSIKIPVDYQKLKLAR